MGETSWIGTADPLWQHLVGRASFSDVYHLPAWHALAEDEGEGEPELFVYAEGPGFVALPLLIRPIEGTDGLEDATSVYGYAGPLVSAGDPTPGLAERFAEALAKEARARGVVSVFSRLHPLAEGQRHLLEGLGEVKEHGCTISIDLKAAPEEQAALYSGDHRRGLARLAKRGFVSRPDPDLEHLDTFVDIYHESMRRVGAADYYFFGDAYFHGLRDRLGPEGLVLILAWHEGSVAAGGLFTIAGDIAQYHLSGIATPHLRSPVAKQVVDAARRHFADRGASVLHLGGGRGGAEDSLFAFKAGFSDRRHPFRTWRWVVDRDAYDRLTAERTRGGDGGGTAAGRFPAYRA